MELPKRVLTKLDQMNQYLLQLENILPAEEQEYRQNLTVRRACEKTVELAIECVISVIAVIISEQKLGLPQSEDDLIDILEKKNILTKPLCTVLRDMKGFRNILVHKYGEINDQQSYQFLTEELDDFARFEKEVKKYLSTVQRRS